MEQAFQHAEKNVKRYASAGVSYAAFTPPSHIRLPTILALPMNGNKHKLVIHR